VLLLCGGRELPARDLISTDEHKACGRLSTFSSFQCFPV
jgi:hypothetical protein